MTNNLTRSGLWVKACAFENEYGSIAFIKACGSSLNRLLVKKGLVTEDELCEAMSDELDARFGKKPVEKQDYKPPMDDGPQPVSAEHKFARLQCAVRELYLAGLWTCGSVSPDEQVALWEQVRDAAEIPRGTATAAGVGK